jgi:membrane-associated phospholipid phosphatase
MTDEASDRLTAAEPGVTRPAPSPIGRRVARVVTEALTPAVLVAGICVAVAWQSGSVGWGIVSAVFASGVPVAYIVRGIRTGRFTDHHVTVREHRPAVIVAAAASVVVGLAVMVLLDAPRDLVALVVAMLAGLVLTFAVTRWWGKVSIHTAVAAGTATTLVLVFGPWLLLAWPFVGVIAWSRVALHEHTVAQTVVGVVLGAVAAGVVFPLVR